VVSPINKKRAISEHRLGVPQSSFVLPPRHIFRLGLHLFYAVRVAFSDLLLYASVNRIGPRPYDKAGHDDHCKNQYQGLCFNGLNPQRRDF